MRALAPLAGRPVSLGAFAALVLVGVVAHADAPAEPPASPAPLDRDPPSTERSASPTAAEWLTAAPVLLARTSPKASSCVATRVREWLRVRCATPTFAISLLGGSHEGLAFWIGGEEEGRFGEVQLPLRRGDRRVVQLWATRDDPSGAKVVVPAQVLQEQWVEGEPAPTVTVL
jgi:hypothetical protein